MRVIEKIFQRWAFDSQLYLDPTYVPHHEERFPLLMYHSYAESFYTLITYLSLVLRQFFGEIILSAKIGN